MPPRPAKKSVAKKASPKGKAAVAPKPSEAPLAVIEEKVDQDVQEVATVKEEADAAPAAVDQEGEAPATAVKVEEVVEKAQDSVDITPTEALDEEDPVEEEEGNDGENTMDVEEGLKTVDKESGEGAIVDKGDGAVNVGDEPIDGGNISENGENNEENEEENEEAHLSDMQAPLAERKKQKEFEIFVGRLDKEAVEDDLIKAFGVFGEIQSVRLVKNPTTQKSKGFGFIRYASTEHAKKAVAEAMNGVQVRGKEARVSASQDNDTLYLGNICKTWTKDNVIDTLKGFGVDQIEHILLPDDPKSEGKIRGFAFVEFSSHSDAVAAYQRLRKPDAVFGRDRSAKVSFSTSLNPSEEAMSQVKTVFVESIPESWDEDKVKEVCKQYGVIDKVQMSRNLKKSKRKDFAFVDFASRESAVACVEGISNAQLGEGEMKVKANLAKPQNRGRLAKQGPRGGFLVNKDGVGTEEGGQSKKKNKAKAVEVSKKGKVKVESKLKNMKGSQPSKPQGKVTKLKTGQPFEGKKRGARSADSATNERPPKKARKASNFGKMQGRPSNVSGNRRNTYSGMPRANYVARPPARTSTYAPPATSYQAHAYPGTYRPNPHYSDLEPHAGYPYAANRVRSYENDQRRAVSYANQAGSSSGYMRGTSAVQASYAAGYPNYAGYEAGYAYPSSGLYAPRRSYY